MVTVAFCLSEMDWLLDLDLSNLEVMKATVRDCHCYRHRPSFWSDRLQPGPMPDGLMTDSNRKWNLLPLYCHFSLDKFSKGNVFWEFTVSWHWGCPAMCVVLVLQQVWCLQKQYLKPIFGYYLGAGCHTESTLTELVDVAITFEFQIRLYTVYIRLSSKRIIFFCSS